MGKLCKRWMFLTGKTGRGRGGDRIISGRIICGMILPTMILSLGNLAKAADK